MSGVDSVPPARLEEPKHHAHNAKRKRCHLHRQAAALSAFFICIPACTMDTPIGIALHSEAL